MISNNEIKKNNLDLKIFNAMSFIEINDFELIKLINCGSNGAVYEVKCLKESIKDIKRNFALKSIIHMTENYKENTKTMLLNRFKYECKILSSIDR
jgi:hypothetical protein